jgi:peptide/nickel transport system substrate-binding protein
MFFLSRRALLQGSAATAISALGTRRTSAAPATLNIAQGAEIDTLDPATFVTFATRSILKHIYTSLVDREGHPLLATSWKLLNDTTWQFELRKGVRFHNSEPLDAEAVKATFDRMRDPATKSTRGRDLEQIKEFQVVNASTLNVLTKAPYAPLLSRLADVQIVPPGATKQLAEKFGRMPVGSGAYRFERWAPRRAGISRTSNSPKRSAASSSGSVSTPRWRRWKAAPG